MVIRKEKAYIAALAVFIICIIAGIILLYNNREESKIGTEIDSFKGVAVYYNGKQYEACHGKNYSTDGYYYGEKWQCVEFVKRFYYQAKKHRMPDVMGNAKDFFDPAVGQGKMNYCRELVQYRNGGIVKPQVDDLLIFTDGEYGHVAIVTEVGDGYIEVIQQNIRGKTRQRITLIDKDGHYNLGDKQKPVGWLRKE